MIKVSSGAITKWKKMADQASNRIRAIREKGEQVTEQVTRTAVVGGTAFGLGVLQGKTGGIEVVGVPFDLLVGVGAHAAGFMKLGGRSSHQLHNVGDGALALYAGTMGRAVGNTWKTTGKIGLPGGKISGELPEGMSGRDSLSDTELANAVLRR